MYETITPSITHEKALDMATHWAYTSEGGYLGQAYGGKQCVRAAMKQPHTEALGEQVTKALHRDLPHLAQYFEGANWEPDGDTLTLISTDGKPYRIKFQQEAS